MTDQKLELSSDAKAVPKRVALVRRETAARVLVDRQELLTTAPHLLLREIVLIEALVGLLAVASLAFDAPLEGIADPFHTPNPAKSPWYFVGLQELLHYFPPVIAGVLLPALAIIAIVVIPYFQANLELVGFYEQSWRKRYLIVSIVVAVVSAVLVLYQVWPVLVPTLIFFVALSLPAIPWTPSRVKLFLARVCLADWIMTWFVTVAVLLTVIGALFRGPGWTWLWLWEEGSRG